MIYNKIISALKKYNLPYREIVHKPMKTIADAIRILGINVGEGTKSIAVKSKSDFFVITVLDNERVDLKNFRNSIVLGKLSLINQQELKNIIGVDEGGLSPLGYQEPIKTYIANNVFNCNGLFINPGRNDRTIEISGSTLKILAEHFETNIFQN